MSINHRRRVSCPTPYPLVSRCTDQTFASPVGVQAKCQFFMKALRGIVLDIPRQQSVVTDPTDETMRLLLLKEEVKDGSLTEELSEERRAEIGVDALERTTHELVFSYEYFNAEQVLRRLLPEGCDVPGSFETVGHIAHLNLRDEVTAYKHVIGRVLLDKNPRLKTVVNKVGAIESEFRVPTWELLAGDTSLETEVRQHGVPFRLDFGEVYWNSRLEAEHKRLVGQIKPGEILCDAMCGIGPFAVPAPGWTEGVRQRPEPVVCGVHKDELRQQQGETPGQVLRRVRA